MSVYERITTVLLLAIATEPMDQRCLLQGEPRN